MKLCPHGIGFDSDGNDLDDCAITPNLCANGTCVNELGSYKCVCDRGFMSTPTMQACVGKRSFFFDLISDIVSY